MNKTLLDMMEQPNWFVIGIASSLKCDCGHYPTCPVVELSNGIKASYKCVVALMTGNPPVFPCTNVYKFTPEERLMKDEYHAAYQKFYQSHR